MKGDNRKRMLLERKRNESWAVFMEYRDQVARLAKVGPAGWDDEDREIVWEAVVMLDAELAYKALEVAALEHGG